MSGPSPEKANSEALLLEMAADIVAAYVSNNAVPAAELPVLIKDIYSNISKIASGAPERASEVPREPAVPIKKSITNDFIVCLEDGKKFMSLKRHLMSAFGMTPAEYRKKWGLPHDYPMVAPAYSSKRSSLAKEAGLGQKLVNTVAEKPVEEITEKTAAAVDEKTAVDAIGEHAAEAAEEPAMEGSDEAAAEAIKEAPVEANVNSLKGAAKKSAAVAAKKSANSTANKPTAKKPAAKKAAAKRPTTKKAPAKRAAAKKVARSKS